MKKQWTTVLDFIQHGKVTSKYKIVEVQGMNTVGDGGALTLVRTGAVGTPSQAFTDTGNNTCVDKNGDVWGLQEGTVVTYNGTDDWFGNGFGNQDKGVYLLGEGVWELDLTLDRAAKTFSNPNLLSNSNFLTSSPDAITHPNATPESYAAGTQIFSGVYAGSSGATVTLIDGRVNCSAGSYEYRVPNTNGLERVPVFASSVSDYDGNPVTTGVSHALVGDEYVVTVTPASGDVFSVKFEQGDIATKHSIKRITTPKVFSSLYKDNTYTELTVSGLSVGDKVICEDYAPGNGAGPLFFTVISSSGQAHDGGKYIDLPIGGYQLRQNMHMPVRATSYGVSSSSSFIEDIAAINRLQMVRMLKNTDFSEFTLDVSGSVYFVGSVNCDRDNIQLEIPKGCFAKAKYDSPSYPPTSVAQSGGFLAFVGYQDPENNDFTVVKDVDNVSVVLNGDVETLYDADHSNEHNNNAIGLFRANDCCVIGTGGVSGSDHRGINFDGDCTNPVIDVGYINNCYTNPASIKGNPSALSIGTCNIGKILKSNFESVNYSIFASDLKTANISVGSYDDQSASSIDQLVFASEVESVSLSIASSANANQLVRTSGCGSVVVSGISEQFDADCTYIVKRGAEGSIPLRSVKVEGAVCGSDCLSALDSTEVTSGGFNLLSVSNCDYSLASSSFEYFSGETSLNRPEIYDIKDNLSPSGYSPSPLYINKKSSQSDNLVSGTPTSFMYDPYSPDRSYTYITLRTLESGSLYVKTFFLETLGGSSSSVIDTMGPSSLSVSSSGTQLTFSIVSGSGQFVNAIAHN